MIKAIDGNICLSKRKSIGFAFVRQIQTVRGNSSIKVYRRFVTGSFGQVRNVGQREVGGAVVIVGNSERNNARQGCK